MPLPWSSLGPAALSLVDAAVVVVDRKGHLVWANPRFFQWTGWSRDELGRLSTQELWEDRERWDEWRALSRLQGGETLGREPLALRTSDGDPIPVEVSLAPLGRSWGHATGTLLVLQDLRPVKLLEKLVVEDPLTGVASRQRILDQLGTDLVRAQRFATSLGIILLDVDGFRGFNDRWGAPFGDQVLRVVGAELRETVAGTGSAGRLGSDEFLVLLPQGTGAHPEVVARSLRAGLEARLFAPEGEPIAVTACLGGLLLRPSAADTPTAVVARVRRHLDRARSQGPNRVEFSP